MTAEKAAGAVDFSYLEGLTGGDARVVDEVLGMFRGQALEWLARLDPQAAEWPALLHNIKGTSRGVGARALGDACEDAENGGPIEPIRTGLNAAIVAIDSYRAQSGG